MHNARETTKNLHSSTSVGTNDATKRQSTPALETAPFATYTEVISSSVAKWNVYLIYLPILDFRSRYLGLVSLLKRFYNIHLDNFAVSQHRAVRTVPLN
jgi:hypothetical protein